MFSKFLSSSLLIGSALALGLTACSDFVRGPKVSEQKRLVEINTDDVKCLEQVPKALQNFFEDETQQDLLDMSVDCVKTSLDFFVKNTQDKTPNAYSDKNLQHYLNRYLLKTSKLSDAFLAEIMKLKVVAVGGDAKSLTPAEIESLNTFLDTLKTEARVFSGRFKLLLFEKDRDQVNQELLEDTENKFLSSLNALFDKSYLASSRYEFEDFKKFVHELDGFVGESKTLKLVIKWLPVIETAKLLFIGDQSKLVSKREWKSAMEWLNRGYFFALKYYYLVKPLDLLSVEDWRLVLPLADQAFDLIETSPTMQSRGVLEANYIDRLINSVWSLKLFDTTLSADLIRGTYRRALVHMIEGQPPGKGNPSGVVGIKLDHYKIIRQEYNIWRLTQMSILDALASGKGMMMSDYSAFIQKYNVPNALKSFTIDSLEKETLYRAWGDWVVLAKQQRPVVLSPGRKLLIRYNGPMAQVSLQGLSWMNANRSFTRLALRGYGQHKSQHIGDSILSEQRLVHLEEDFREFGRAVGFLDSRQPSPAERTFQEGNFFTFHGNGDDWLSATETYELLNALLSGGKAIVREIMNDLDKNKCLLKEVDVFNERIANEACFKKLLRTQARKYFDNMGWIGEMIVGFNDKEYEAFYKSLVELSRLPVFKPGTIEYGEIRTGATVLQYVETLFVTYDKDFNRTLSEDEIVAAFPRFKKFIEKMAGNTWFTEDIFLYLVYEGKAPTGVTEIMTFKAKRALGLGEVTKLQLINVLGVLKNSI